MIPAWQLISISVLYIGSLFWVAWYGDKRAQKKKPIHNSALVYSLSLAVYCTSWTFYGVVGQASTSGWSFLAVYVGPVLFIWFFWRLLAKIIRIAKEKRITSIADFIATRYGRDNSLAVLVTLVAMLGVVPYIALQLKAVTVAFNLLSSPHELGALAIASTEAWHDTALYVSVAMALFVIIFGTRDIDASEQHPGMMLAVAFESLVKLIAFMAVGIWVVCYLFEQPLDLFTLARNTSPDHPLFKTDIISLSFVLQSLLAAFAMLCLPRQFQVGVIENESIQHVKAARWMFPAYLMLMLLFVVPIALSGNLFMKDLGFGPDTYVLSLPIAFDQELLAIIAFIGGTSAATGMIIVATIAISTMVSNELILPMVFHRSQSQADLKQSSNIRTLVLTVRRLVIVAMILGSYLFYRTVGEFESLAAIGLLSFAVVAQFAPSLIGGLLWQRANHQGAMAGIISGTFIWFYTLLLPVLDNSSGGLIGTPSLAMMGENLDNFSSGVILSLLVNIFCFIFFSIISSASVRERMLASDFSSAKGVQQNQPTTALNCKVDDVRVVLERILGLQKTESFFISYQYQHGVQYNHAPASDELLHDAEKMLGSVVGSSSARVIFSTLLGGEQIQIRDLTFIASEASQAFAMSQEQLQAAVENLHQGVSVIDKDLNLVAWNSRYLQLFEYPESFIQTGKPIHDIIAFNARRGFCGPGDIEAQVNRRMKFLRNGSAHQFERTLPNGLVISMQGHPMPDGGFVTSFTDITAHRRAEQTLKQANIKLERRVEESSQELEDLTSQLIEANHSKSRFLAATGHDLMQPLNAAKLFASTLAQQSLNTEQQELLSHLEGSLQSAEDVLSILVEISKLDAGAMEPDIRPISLSAVLKPLRDEFTALAAEKGLSLTVRVCDAWVLSDAHWLRRIIQNLLGNAVRYTQSGRVLLGCRKRGNKLAIEVWDTGPGIPKEKLPEIFGEFKRLHTEKQDTKGLGLGLAIVDRMANQLDHDINVASVVGKGTRFRITLSLTEAQQDEQKSAPSVLNQAASFEGMKTFCIDNDPEVLTAMNALLNSWQCDVYSCSDIATATQVPFKPEIMLCDYQLDNDETGIQTMTLLRQQFDDPALPGILISADPRPEVADEARSLGFYFLSKPVRPAALRALIRKLVKK